jgi:5-methylcytosine-specific restriction endonuclease McrA
MSLAQVGRKHSPQTKEKMRIAHLGHKFTDQHRANISKSHKGLLTGRRTGPENPSWAGGITPLADTIRKSAENEVWRRAVVIRDKRCQFCNAYGALDADHIKPFSELLRGFLNQYNQFSPIEDKETLARIASKHAPFWDIENGRSLCRPCHKKTYTFGRRLK